MNTFEQLPDFIAELVIVPTKDVISNILKYFSFRGRQFSLKSWILLCVGMNDIGPWKSLSSWLLEVWLVERNILDQCLIGGVGVNTVTTKPGPHKQYRVDQD